MSDGHDGRLLSFVEDELPDMSPALPCNILKPVQPVNQPEVEVANESARRLLPFSQGYSDISLALPFDVREALQSDNPEDVVDKLLQNLQLEHTSLKQPELRTRKSIRCLAKAANCSNRLDVVKYLRQITPAGTTGPLLSETLAVRNIPLQQRRKITISLSGGEEWKLVAEKLRFSPDEIRFLDKRTLNPAEAMLGHIAYKYPHATAGDLYDVLTACELPVMADLI